MSNQAINTLSDQIIDTGKEFQGIYGKYTITEKAKLEVKYYRISVLSCGISFTIGLLHWFTLGPVNAWIWLMIMSISLGYSLKWIHIYIKIIHKILILLWAIGSISILILQEAR